MKGCISAYKEDRGFGFIEGEDERRYFLHVSELVSGEDKLYLAQGVNVEFMPSTEERGLRARKIQVLDRQRDSETGDVLWFDEAPERPWVVSASCDYRIRSRSLSRRDARQMLMNRALSLGANALCHVRYRNTLWFGHEYTASPLYVAQQGQEAGAMPLMAAALPRQAAHLHAVQALEAKEYHKLIKRRGLMVMLPISLILVFASFPALVAMWLSACIVYPFAISDITWLLPDAASRKEQ